MENKEKNIDDLFREGLGDYAETPPPAAWDRLQLQLKNAPAKPPAGPNRKYGYFAIVALLLLLGASVVRNIAGTRERKAGAAVNENSFARGPQAKNNSADANTKDNITGRGTLANPTAANDDQKAGADNTTNTNNLNDKQAIVHTYSKSANSNKTGADKSTEQTNKRHPGNNGYATKTPHKKSGIRKEAAKNNNNEDNDNEVVYNSTTPKVALKSGPAADAQQSTKEQPKPTTALPKPAPLKPTNVAATTPAHKKKVREPFNLFDAGIKVGYETGFDNDAAKKAIISPYLQLNLSPKLAIMLQPAIKQASLDTRRIGTAQGYYKVNNDGKITQTDSLPLYVPEGSNIVDTLIRRDYAYTQSHDSIVKTNTIGGSYTEFELPILLKYNLTKSLSVYGGVNMVYSRMVTIKENTVTTANITRNVSQHTVSEYNGPATAPQPLDSVITYTGTPYSNYTGPQYSTTQSSQLRYGYMLGFTYQYSKRWLVDALVQQTFANTNIQGGYNINSALSAAYLRVTLGYKLTK